MVAFHHYMLFYYQNIEYFLVAELFPSRNQLDHSLCSLYQLLYNIFFIKTIMNVKVVYEKEVHVIDMTEVGNIEEFKRLIKSQFNLLPQSYTFETSKIGGQAIDQFILKQMCKKVIKLSKIYIIRQSQFEGLLQNISESQFSRLEFDDNDLLADKLIKIDLNERSNTSVTQHKNYVNLIQHKSDKLINLVFQIQKQEQQKRMKIQKENNIKAKIQEEPQPFEDQLQRIVYDNVQCDICFAFPIVGPVFKCIVCKQFDLCNKCQQKYHHFHPVLKIESKNHYPTQIKVIFSSQKKSYMSKQLKLQKQQIKIQKTDLKQHRQKDIEIQIDPQFLNSRTRRSKNFLSSLAESDFKF